MVLNIAWVRSSLVWLYWILAGGRLLSWSRLSSSSRFHSCFAWLNDQSLPILDPPSAAGALVRGYRRPLRAFAFYQHGFLVAPATGRRLSISNNKVQFPISRFAVHSIWDSHLVTFEFLLGDFEIVRNLVTMISLCKYRTSRPIQEHWWSASDRAFWS